MAKRKPPASAPLLSWDIYMEGYWKLMRRGEDLQQLKKLSKKNGWRAGTWNLEEQVLHKQRIVLVTDTAQIILFASHHMREMNGYEPHEVVGKTPRLFQGPLTEDDKRQALRMAIQQRLPLETDITNYHKDGSLYRCRVREYPVWNRDGKLVNFIAFEEVAA